MKVNQIVNPSLRVLSCHIGGEDVAFRGFRGIELTRFPNSTTFGREILTRATKRRDKPLHRVETTVILIEIN